jgi:hypothetical protein
MSEHTQEIQRIIAETFPELLADAQADLKPCPADIADVILRILETGVIQARSAGWSEDAAPCAAQANHIHNLPDLLRRYSPRKLKYYWNTERSAFIRQMGGQPIVFEELWAELEPLVPQTRKSL